MNFHQFALCVSRKDNTEVTSFEGTFSQCTSLKSSTLATATKFLRMRDSSTGCVSAVRVLAGRSETEVEDTYLPDVKR